MRTEDKADSLHSKLTNTDVKENDTSNEKLAGNNTDSKDCPASVKDERHVTRSNVKQEKELKQRTMDDFLSKGKGKENDKISDLQAQQTNDVLKAKSEENSVDLDKTKIATKL